jgi:hypothetical protein
MKKNWKKQTELSNLGKQFGRGFSNTLVSSYNVTHKVLKTKKRKK